MGVQLDYMSWRVSGSIDWDLMGHTVQGSLVQSFPVSERHFLGVTSEHSALPLTYLQTVPTSPHCNKETKNEQVAM